MANGPIATILARLGDCFVLVSKSYTAHLNACAAQDAEGVKAQYMELTSALSDVRTQLQGALNPPQGELDIDGALAKSVAWLEKGVDSEIWNTMRALADEVNRLRPLATASEALAQREREFAQNCERVMAGMQAEVAALTKARKDASAEVDRLTDGLNRIATDYDYSAAGKVAKQVLGIVDNAPHSDVPVVPRGQ